MSENNQHIKTYATKKYVDDSIAQASLSGEVNTTNFALKSELFSKDYNDLENKPCYENSTFGTNVITFDGTIKETDEIIDISDMEFAIKILDFPIQKENLIGKTAKLLRIEEGEITYTLNQNHFLDGSTLGIDGIYFIFEGSAFVVFEDNADFNGLVFNKGTYFIARKPGSNPTHITYLEYEGEIKDIKQLDEKFIPDTIATKEYVDDKIAQNGFSGDYNDLENKPCYIANETELFRISLADLKSNIETAIANKKNYFMINMDLFPVNMESYYYLSFNGQELIPNYKNEYPELYFYMNSSDDDTIHRINISFYGKNSWVNNNWATDETKTLVEIIFTKYRTNENTVGYDDIKNEILNYYTDDIVLIEREKVTLNNQLLDKDLKIENSLSMLREGDVGTHSVSLGSCCMATGPASFSVGTENIASGASSSALGIETKAIGQSSHAEGNNTIAEGHSAHAEGFGTTANGYYSHAEGSETTANGMASHAEGLGTIASSVYQHVQGQYNIEDVENNYAHIVGNGENNDTRSNAHTLDWDGNAWFQGNVSIDGTPTNDNDLVTKEYVDTKSHFNYEWITICEHVSSAYMNGYDYVFPNLKIEPHAHIEFALDVTDINGNNRIIEFVDGETEFDFYNSEEQIAYMSVYMYDENYDLIKDNVEFEVYCFDENNIKIEIYAQDTDWEDLTINEIVYLKQLQVQNKITDLELDNISYFKLTNKPSWLSFYDQGMLGILRNNFVEALINRCQNPVIASRENIVSPFTDNITATIHDGSSGPMNCSILTIRNVIYSVDARNAVGFRFIANQTQEYSIIRVFAENAIVTITDENGNVLKENKNKKTLLKEIYCSLTEGNMYYVLYSNEDGTGITIPEHLPFTVEYDDGLNDPTKIMYMDNMFEYSPTSEYNPATKKYVDDTVANATPAIITEEDINTIIADIDN